MIETSKRKLYLHIGYHKTGTTAIQACLYEDHRLFLKHGYHYPLISLRKHAHHNLAWEMRKFHRFSRQDGTLADLVKEIERIHAPRVIISSEEFCKCNEAEIQTLAQGLQAYDVTVIAYLRRQDQLLQSSWAQVTKTGNQTASFSEWVDSLEGGQTTIAELRQERIIPPLDYAAAIAQWAAAFGQENIRIRPYERSQMHPNILVDFMQTCDLQDSSWLPESQQHNVSPGIKTLETIRYLSIRLRENHGLELGKQKPSHALFINRIRDTADELGWNNERLNLITPAIYQQIMGPLEAGNREIARRYLGREELFSEPFREKLTTDFSIDNLTAEEAIDVIGPAFAHILRQSLGGNSLYRRLYYQFARQFAGNGRLMYFIERHPQIARKLKALYQRLA